VIVPLNRRARLRVDVVASSTGVHPELLRRLVALGLVDAEPGERGELLFATSAPRRVARIQRLHNDLSLNYAAIGLVLDLLDRIDRLEEQLRETRQTNPRATSGG
jgi:chaperone modulatory protein CbpM